MLTISYRKIATGIAVLLCLAFYDTLFDWLLHLLHILFETLEYVVEELIEAIFGTEHHTAQAFTIYGIVGVAVYQAYRFYLSLPARFVHLKAACLARWQKFQTDFSHSWLMLSFWEKIQWLAIVLSFFYIASLLLF